MIINFHFYHQVSKFSFLPPRPQVINKMKIGVILLAYHFIFISEGVKSLEEEFIMISPTSLQKIYIEEHMTWQSFYEWVDTHGEIIGQGEHYTIIAQKHLVREEQDVCNHVSRHQTLKLLFSIQEILLFQLDNTISNL